ncbi:hypothetical protein [Sinomonas humi]|nr:hypothetical protein [Sinomonas humi]
MSRFSPRSLVAPIALLALATAALTGCSPSSTTSGASSPTQNAADNSVGGWVGTAQGAAMFLQWTRNGDNVTGSLVETNIQSSDTTKTQNYNDSFTGTISGSSATLTFSGVLGATSNLSASLQGGNIIMSFPQSNGTIDTVTMTPGSVAQYNEDVSSLNGQAQANAQASASAAAAAAQASASAAAEEAFQQRVNSEQQQASNDLASLQHDDDFTPGLKAMEGDLTQTAADLQRTRSDAAKGGGDQCLNASTTVYNDAATTVYNDVQTNLYNHSLDLENQAQTVRQEVSNLQSDLQALQNDGATGPSEAPSEISGANAAIAATVAAANQHIDQGNAYVATSYQVANGIAVGPCAGTGPGNPPEPVKHIN